MSLVPHLWIISEVKMVKLQILILGLCINVLGLPTNKGGCLIDIAEDLTYQHALILHPVKNEFVLPNIPNGISFSIGESIRLACPGQSNHLSINSQLKEVTATCVGDTIFDVSNNVGNKKFKDLRCSSYPEATAKRSGNKCASSFTEIEIGFEIANGFVPVLINCFDESKKDTIYSTYNLTSKIGSQQNSVPRPNDFHDADFYNELNPKPTTLYKRKNERIGFERILGSAKLAAKYISLQSDFFLSKGHFTAKADFVYGSQQRATFFYVNVAPQWQTFNGKNWNALEMSVREYAGKQKSDLVVYTGVFGNAQLPDINNKMQNLYLFVNNDREAISVPAIYYKILHNPGAKTATVFIGHNNPYEEDVTPICTDVCNKIDWLSWDAKNVVEGYSYCCNYEEFKRIVDYLPELPVQGLLT